MKKKFLRFFLMFMCILSIFSFVGCRSKKEEPEANSFSINNGILTIYGSGVLTNFWGDASESIKEIKFSENSSFETISKNTFENYQNLESIEIPASIKDIEQDVFKGCTKLKSVNYLGTPTICSQINFSNIYSTPNYYATEILFKNEELKNLVIDNEFYEVKQYTFYNLKNLESISVSTNIIAPYAFYNCSNTINLFLSNTQSIYNNAFENCESLQNVYFTGNVSNWLDISFENLYSNPLTYSTNLFFNNKLVENIEIKNRQTISKFTFANYKTLKEVSLDSNVESVHEYAFYNCSNANITIPNNNNIYNYYQHCFDNCKSVSDLVFNDSLKYIGDFAFSNCYNSTNITIPNSVYYIGEQSFAGCQNVIECVLPFVGTKLQSEIPQTLLFGNIFGTTPKDGCTLVKQTYGWGGTSQKTSYIPNTIKSVKITSNISKIGFGAFQNCSMLTDISIPNSVSVIEMNAFSGCNLSNFYYKGNADEWASINFANAIFTKSDTISTTTLYFNETKVETLEFNNIKTINKYAFYGVKDLKTIKFNEELESIKEGAFSLCSELVSIDFTNCENLKSIETYCFYRCSNLDNINMSYCINLTSLSTYVFSNCKNLTTITIPNSITQIQGCAFYNCSNLENINCVDEYSINYLGDDAFAYCSKLKSIYIKNILSGSGNPFRYSNKSLIIYTSSNYSKQYYIDNNTNAVVKTNYTYQDYINEK